MVGELRVEEGEEARDEPQCAVHARHAGGYVGGDVDLEEGL